MKVENIHYRDLPAAPHRAGQLIDHLGGESDVLWPKSRWPAMRFDRPLQVGANGGHGPIRYTVEELDPGKSVTFRLNRPKGFHGMHRFDVEPRPDGSRLRHVLAMNTTGTGTLAWLLVFRPLHDALLEDALDNAAREMGDVPKGEHWSLWVRVLRRLLRRGAMRKEGGNG